MLWIVEVSKINLAAKRVAAKIQRTIKKRIVVRNKHKLWEHKHRSKRLTETLK